jgi:hypothetical protein
LQTAAAAASAAAEDIGDMKETGRRATPVWYIRQQRKRQRRRRRRRVEWRHWRRTEILAATVMAIDQD